MEDSRKKEQPDIREELRDAEKVEEKQITVEPSNEGLDMQALKMKSMGWSYIYETKTGDRSITLNSMLEANLKKRNSDGTPRFTTRKPLNPPHPIVRGTFKCRLHKDDPERKRWDEMGFPECPKDDLASRYQVIRHMEKRHRSEWATIQYEAAETKRQEDRDFQGAMVEGLRETIKSRSIPTEAPLYVSDKDKKKKSLAG